MYEHADRSIAYWFPPYQFQELSQPSCLQISVESLVEYEINGYHCRGAIGIGDITRRTRKKYVCEVETLSDVPIRPQVVEPPVLSWTNLSVVQCPDQHVTQRFLACDVQAACWSQTGSSGYSDNDRKSWAVPSRHTCPAPLTSLPPSFLCRVGKQRIPYTLICDHRQDCVDNSDENFCLFPQCSIHEQSCDNSKQCYPYSERCNGYPYCINAADESRCVINSHSNSEALHPPVKVIIHNFKLFFSHERVPLLDTKTGAALCPSTHFQCAGGGYCLPVFVLCNGVNDCPGREDEAGCDRPCVGFYRCRGSMVCLHPQHVCDGLPQCPQRDDELLCHLHCPVACTCHGLAFTCRGQLHVHDIDLDLRYLDVSGTGMMPQRLRDHAVLIHLSVAACGLKSLDGLLLSNLKSVDLSDNYIPSVDTEDMKGFPNLEVLFLSGNPLVSVFAAHAGVSSKHLFNSLKRLDLSRVTIHAMDLSIFDPFPNLEVLNLSHSRVHKLTSTDNAQPPERISLSVLDMEGCPLPVLPKQVLRGMTSLQRVVSGNPKLCCQAVLPPNFPMGQCLAEPVMDQISSCDDLLGSRSNRAAYAIFTALNIIGYIVSFVIRARRREKNFESLDSGFRIFLNYLCVFEVLMGVCLCAVLGVDQVYRGVHLWHDTAWRGSLLCRVVGFVSTLSRNMTSLLVLLMALDRSLEAMARADCYRFTVKTAHMACLVTLTFCVLLGSLPLWPVMSQGEYYGHSELCLPYPAWRKEMGTRSVFHVSAFTALNTILFVTIAAGQCFLYHHTQTHDTILEQVNKTDWKPVLFACRVRYLAMSHLLYCLLVGGLGTMAAAEIDLPKHINASHVIFVHPLSSAVDPYLYILGVHLEHRRRARREKLLERLEKQSRLRQSKKGNVRSTALISVQT